MSANTTASSVPPSPPSGPAPKKSRWLLYTLGTLCALLLVIVATVVVTLWWIQRPIKPVVLSASEKAAVEEKLQHLGSGAPTAGGTAATDVNEGQDRPYVPGSRVLTLTEREINGLLNANTDLGKSLRLEFARNAINAYLAVPIPEDFPIGGGRMFRARGRFSLSLGNGEPPHAVLEDVSIFGLSLPKAWMAGLKGENLIGEAMGKTNGSPILQGIKSMRIEPGALVIEVEE